MGTHRSPRSKIRGWFPQEPIIIKMPLVGYSRSGLALAERPQSAMRISVNLILMAITSTGFVVTFSRYLTYVLAAPVMAAALAGSVALGLFLGAALTYRELKVLARAGQASTKLSSISFLITALTLVATVFLSAFYYPQEIWGTAFLCVFVTIATYFDSKAALIFGWERKYRSEVWVGKNQLLTMPKPKNPRGYPPKAP
ncbi:MAG: hypothetical protein NWE93_08180 [Candidatus Bathyarchaeota archaeon]|nr:hypothetical protein [Candidatus Bathyarchaeota archaeon]